MTFFYFILLGLIQGITEFLPVSSTAHLNLIPKLFGFCEPSREIDVFLNLGSLLAIFVFFSDEIKFYFFGFLDSLKFLKTHKKTENMYHFISIFLASLPTLIIFGIAEIVFDVKLSSHIMSSSFLIIFGVVLYFCDRNKVQKNKRPTKKDAFFVGLAQVLSIFPGVSRLGACLSAMRFLGYSREMSFKFSMILSIPPVLGAIFLKGIKFLIYSFNIDVLYLFSGVFSAFIFGIFALKLISKFLQTHTFLLIIIYRILFGIIFLMCF